MADINETDCHPEAFAFATPEFVKAFKKKLPLPHCNRCGESILDSPCSCGVEKKVSPGARRNEDS